MKALFITYNGLTEPLGRRQVLPYVVALARRGWGFVILSFEKPETADPESMRTVEGIAKAEGIEWRALPYSRGSSVVKAFDIVRGLLSVLREWPRRPNLIHARSTVAAAIATLAAACLRIPWIFDVRGLVAEEYVDGGHWPAGGVLHRATQSCEAWLLRQADGLVFLTERVRKELLDSNAIRPTTPTEVIPCCADLQVFHPDPDARTRLRVRHGLGDSWVLVYSGSLGSWYDLDAMIAFVKVASRHLAGLRFLILSPQAMEAMPSATRAGFGESTIAVSVRPDEVPAYLAAADAGLCFLRDVASKRASSPTKYAEYLASGLPVVCDSWTGDNRDLSLNTAFICLDSLSEDALARAAVRLTSLLADPQGAREAARQLAREQFSLEIGAERYDRLYRDVSGRDRWS